MFNRKTIAAIAILILLTQTLLYSLNPAHSSTYAYNPLQATAHPVNPPLTLACHPRAVPYDITRVSRGALVYTDFEDVTDWTNLGGYWYLTTGYKGQGIEGIDTDNGGLGGESQLIYVNSINLISGWITTKTKLIGGIWYGIPIIDSYGRMFTVEIDSSGSLEIWRYYNKWKLLSSTNIPSYNPSSWYVLVIFFDFTPSSFGDTSININVLLYDTNGALVTQLQYRGTLKNYIFIPAYYGVLVDDAAAVFDDFILSGSSSDPRYIVFQSVPAGYGVSVYDASGFLVNSTVSTGGDTLLGVVSDTVVGTGSGGSIIASYPEGLPALNYTVPLDDAILGGDVYSVSAMTPSCTLGANSTSASVSARISSSSSKVTGGILLKLSNNDGKPLYARLILADYMGPNTLTVNLTIASRDGQATPPIIIASGAVASNTTGWFTIPAGSTSYLYAKGYFSSTNQNATLKVYVQYCTLAGGGGAYTYYPVLVNLTS